MTSNSFEKRGVREAETLATLHGPPALGKLVLRALEAFDYSMLDPDLVREGCLLKP
jgi:hypothetical protein